MVIIPGENVDLLTPFPAAEAVRAYGWNHCYRTFIDDDLLPKEREEFKALIEGQLASALSCAVIDKKQLTSTRHEAPLIGIVMLLPSGPRDGQLHLASGRKAFKMGLMTEALALALPSLWSAMPLLTRITCTLDEGNTPVKSLLKELGFRFEGVMHDAYIRLGAVHQQAIFGLTRRTWEATLQPPAAQETHTDEPRINPADVDADYESARGVAAGDSAIRPTELDAARASVGSGNDPVSAYPADAE